jgi:hypothetical protein
MNAKGREEIISIFAARAVFAFFVRCGSIRLEDRIEAVVQLFSSRTFQAAMAFLICFAVGALLSTIMGLDLKSWLFPGIVTSAIVAWSVFRASGSKER